MKMNKNNLDYQPSRIKTNRQEKKKNRKRKRKT